MKLKNTPAETAEADTLAMLDALMTSSPDFAAGASAASEAAPTAGFHEFCTEQSVEPEIESPPEKLLFPLLGQTIERVALPLIVIRDQLRKEYLFESIEEMAASLKLHGQLQPGCIDEDNTLIFGHRRYFGLEMAGIPWMNVIRIPGRLTDAVVKTLQIVENLQQEKLSPTDFYQGLKDLAELCPGITMTQLAKRVGKTVSTISRALSPDKTIAPVKEAFLAGKLSVGHVTEIAMLAEAEQPAALEKALANETRDGLAAARRKAARPKAKRAGAAPLQQIDCPLPCGVRVVVKAAHLTLEAVVEALVALADQAASAKANGHGLSEFEASCQANAKSGSPS